MHTHRLPIAAIPEQVHIAFVRGDMIDQRSSLPAVAVPVNL